MQYTKGTQGRIFVIKFDDAENPLESLKELAVKEGIKSGILHIIGGLRRGRIVAGPQKDKIPPEPIWKDINEPREIIATGTIFWQSGRPSIHIHGAMGKEDNISVGCMRESAEVFLLMEAIIIEINGINAERIPDPVTGLNILSIKDNT